MLATQTATEISPNGSVDARRQPGGFISSRFNWLLIIPLLLLTTALAARYLNRAFWVDEVITVERAGSPIHGGPLSPAQIWERTASQTYDQVPGYFWLVSAWDNVFGWSEFSSRLLSLLAGLLAVAWTYRLGRDLHSPLAGLGAALTVACSAFFIHYQDEARVYALSVLLGALIIWLYWRVITRRTGWMTQMALLVSAAAVLYAHYFASLLVFSLCLYHLLFVPRNREWWRVVVIMGAAGALFLPWFLTSFDVVQGANSETWRQNLNLTAPELLDALLKSFSNGSVAALLIVGALAARARRPAERYVWFLLLGCLALALGVNLWLKMLVSPKFFLYLWVPLGLLVGVGLARLAARGLPPALVLAPWLLVGIWSTLTWQDDPVMYVEWKALHQQLAAQVQPDDAIVFHMSAANWDGQHDIGIRHYFDDFPTLPGLLVSWPHDSDERYLRGLDSIVGDRQRVWSAFDPQRRPARISAFESAMGERGFAECGNAARDPAMEVDLFARPPEVMLYRFGSDLYDDGIRMAVLGSITQERGGLLIPLGWQMGADVPVNTYSFAVHVLDSSGALAAQVDTGLPPDYAFGCQAVQIPKLAPGHYQAVLVVYAWETGARLNALSDGVAAGDSVSLGAFTVGA